jgi:hypothetical protein
MTAAVAGTATMAQPAIAIAIAGSTGIATAIAGIAGDRILSPTWIASLSVGIGLPRERIEETEPGGIISSIGILISRECR